MIASSRSYAIGMVHFQLGGGARALALVLGSYLILFLGGAALFYYESLVQPGFTRDAGEVVLVLLMGLQGLALLLVGGYRVSSAVRRDISTHMIESHRLMPISSPNAVFGYIFGPTTAVTMFALLNLGLTMAFGGFVGASLERMAINQGVIFAFAVFVWSMTAMGTFIYRHIFFVALAVMFFGTCTQLVVVAYAGLPGFAMLMTPVVGETIFSFRGGAPAYDAVYTMGIAGQAVLFGIFFLGSCRLYRGTYPTALSVFLGMLLLGVWAGLSATGIGLSDQLAMTRIIRQFRGDGLDTVQVVMSLASCMLLSAVPFWAALQEERAGKSNSWLMHVLLVTLAGVLVSVPAWGAGQLAAMSTRTMVVTLLCGGAQVLTIHCLLRMVRSMRLILALLITGMALLALWLGPLVLELVRVILVQRGGGVVDSMSVLGTLSPGALLGQLWSNNPGWYAAGLVWQWFVAGVLTFAVVIAAIRGRRRVRGFPVSPSRVPVPATLPPARVPPPLPASTSQVSRPVQP